MKLVKMMLSTKVSFLLMVAFAVAMGVATFMENDYGTATAREAVYEAWWFELLMIWLAINFLAHIEKYKLFTRKRWPLGLFHIAFVLMIIGAGVTRFFGKEGIIHIREGEVKYTYSSSGRYLQLSEAGEEGPPAYEKPLELSTYTFKPQTVSASLDKQAFTISFEEYIKGAHEEFIPGTDTLLDIAVAFGTGREDYLLHKGENLPIGTLELSTSEEGRGQVKLLKEDSVWMIRSEKSLHVVEVNTRKKGLLKAGEILPLQIRTLYQIDSGAFLVKGIYEGKKLVYHFEEDEELARNLPDVVKIKVTDQSGEELLNTYTPLVSQDPKRHVFYAGDKKYTLAYGPRTELLPFALELRAFELERYPGSQSPASYASELQVIDHDTNFPYRVFMNNVLDYKGYRFYQASYDKDEKGTILSVSQDRPGTYITYLSYFLLTVGMFFTFFVKGSRFSILNRRLNAMNKEKEEKQKKGLKSPSGEELAKEHVRIPEAGILTPKVKVLTAITLLMALLFSFRAYAHNSKTPDISGAVVPVEQAKAYGQLVVQDLDGRMKPLNTLANEIIRKLSGRSTITIEQERGDLTLNAEQFLLAVQLSPAGFSALPLIKIDEKVGAIFAALHHSPMSSISFRELLDADGRYLLHELVEEANRLKPAERNEGHKELLKVDERFNIFYAILSGDFLRLFPNRLDENNTWFTAHQHDSFEEEDGIFVKNVTGMYLSGVQKGIASGNWEEATEVLSYMKRYQQKAGASVYPGETMVKAELLYNQLNLGNRLFGLFWLLGAAMLVLAIVKLFSQPKWLSYAWTAGLVIAWIGLALFTFHLGLRWYIAGHAPWSDGFEMLIFVAWCILLFGLLFAKSLTLPCP